MKFSFKPFESKIYAFSLFLYFVVLFCISVIQYECGVCVLWPVNARNYAKVMYRPESSRKFLSLLGVQAIRYFVLATVRKAFISSNLLLPLRLFQPKLPSATAKISPFTHPMTHPLQRHLQQPLQRLQNGEWMQIDLESSGIYSLIPILRWETMRGLGEFTHASWWIFGLCNFITGAQTFYLISISFLGYNFLRKILDFMAKLVSVRCTLSRSATFCGLLRKLSWL